MQEIQEQSQYTVGTFRTEEEAEAACHALREAGFESDRISFSMETIDPTHGIEDQHAAEGVKGGASLGALFGGLVGWSLVLLANNLPSTVVNGDLNPLVGILAGAIVGGLSIGLIGGISSGRASQTRSGPGSNGKSLSYEYRVMVSGTPEDAKRATEILPQPTGEETLQA
jgi:hypothetical protein